LKETTTISEIYGKRPIQGKTRATRLEKRKKNNGRGKKNKKADKKNPHGPRKGSPEKRLTCSPSAAPSTYLLEEQTQ